MKFLPVIIIVVGNIFSVKKYECVSGTACSFQVWYDTIKNNTPYIITRAVYKFLWNVRITPNFRGENVGMQQVLCCVSYP